MQAHRMLLKNITLCKKFLAGLTVLSLFLLSCKSKTEEPEPDDPNKKPYPGRLSTYSGYPVYYNSEGLLTEYSFNDSQNANLQSTVTLSWTPTEMTFSRTGGAFGLTNAIYKRNTAGYCAQSEQDYAHDWQYDSLNRVKLLDGIAYFWNGENIDSIRYLGYTEIYEYSTALESRNIGMKFIPRLLHNYPIMGKNLRIKMTRVKSSTRDTTDTHRYGHAFNAAGWVVRETDTTRIHDTIRNIVSGTYSYYE